MIKKSLSFALACSCAFSPARGQFTGVQAISSSGLNTVSCPTGQQQLNTDPVTASAATNCGTITAIALSSSSLTHTASHVSALVSGIITGNNTGSAGSAFAEATAGDVIQVSGATPTFFRFFYAADGTFSSTATQVPGPGGSSFQSQSDAAAEFAFYTTSGIGANQTTLTDQASYTLTTASQAQGASIQSVSAGTTARIHGDLFSGFIDIPYFGGGYLDFQSIFAATAEVGGGGPNDVGSASVDFSHTFGLTGIDPLDTNGNSMLGQTQLTLVSGTAYFLGDPNAITTAPEPSSMALLGTGLIGLAPLRRRFMRRRTAQPIT